jgi:hypothetical protein
MLRSVIPNMAHPGQAFFSMGQVKWRLSIWNHSVLARVILQFHITHVGESCEVDCAILAEDYDSKARC